MGKCDHPRRLLCVQKELILPRDEAAKQGTLNKSLEPFGVRVKQFWDVAETKHVRQHDEFEIVAYPLSLS